MKHASFPDFLIWGGALTLLVLCAGAVLRWLAIPVGDMLDWMFGIASFWWLLVVLTVPWNMHFQAREVLDDAATSQQQNIPVDQQQIAFVRRWMQLSLLLAIALHLLSAVALYGLAVAGISPIGYVAAGAALLLVALRPAVRAYDYLAMRLETIQRGLRYPREDVVKLRGDLATALERIAALEAQTNPEQPGSWAAHQQEALQRAEHEIDQLHARLKELERSNAADHARLAREAQQAIAQLSEDGRFLQHVREIIRFVKEA